MKRNGRSVASNEQFATQHAPRWTVLKEAQGACRRTNAVLCIIWNRIGMDHSFMPTDRYSFLKTQKHEMPKRLCDPATRSLRPLLERTIFAATMIVISLNGTTATAQFSYAVTNSTNSYWKVNINCSDGYGPHLAQHTVGATRFSMEDTDDGAELTLVTLKTSGGTTIATSNEGYYHALGCSDVIPPSAGYADVAPSLATNICVQWANDGPEGGSCNILYGF